MSERHKLIQTSLTDEAAEWACPVCKRCIRMEFGPGKLSIIEPGDQLVNHGLASTVPGLSMFASAEKLEVN